MTSWTASVTAHAVGACRSPYDLARDKRLWVEGAYESLEEALDSVDVDENDLEAAVTAIQNARERGRAAAYLLR